MSHPLRPGRLGAIALLLAMTGPGLPARADADYERASRAVAAGEALPLQQILEQARRQFGGEVLDAEFEEEHGGKRYEVKLLAGDGRVLKLTYDAATGALLSEKARPAAAPGQR